MMCFNRSTGLARPIRKSQLRANGFGVGDMDIGQARINSAPQMQVDRQRSARSKHTRQQQRRRNDPASHIEYQTRRISKRGERHATKSPKIQYRLLYPTIPSHSPHYLRSRPRIRSSHCCLVTCDSRPCPMSTTVCDWCRLVRCTTRRTPCLPATSSSAKLVGVVESVCFRADRLEI
jgi:hypothetical protein